MEIEKLTLSFAIASFGLGFFIMYYVYIVVDPTYQILNEIKDIANVSSQLAKNTNEVATDTNQIINTMDTVLNATEEQNQLMLEQNKLILDNQTDNSGVLKQLLFEQRRNQEQAIYYLFSSMNQSNKIGNDTRDIILQQGNTTAGLILDNLRHAEQLQRNISQTHTNQTAGILKGVTSLFEQLVPSSNQTNQTKLSSIQDLFKPIALLTRTGQIYNDTSGQISSFFGGPAITNETINELMNRTNTTGNITN